MTSGEDLRALMRFVPHGVAVLAVDDDGDRMGVTVSSLVSLSLEPPLVGVSIGKQASLYELLRSAGAFAVSLLGGEQEELARRFAAGQPPIVHWQGVADARGAVRAADRRRARLDRGRARAPSTTPATTRSSSPTSSRSSTGPRTTALMYRDRTYHSAVIEAVVFDLDGVLIQSEEVWDEVREAYVRERGGRYDDEVQRAMMGMSSPEWSRYLHEAAGVPDEPRGDQRRGRPADARGATASGCR